MEPHVIYDWDDKHALAYVHEASAESVDRVMNAPTNTGDGRSKHVWVRLMDGTLVLGVFPQGDTYCEVEEDARYPGK